MPFGLLRVTPAIAQDGTATPDAVSFLEFGVAPKGEADASSFDEELDPGESTELTLTITNLYTEALDLRSYVADSYTLVNGGFGVEQEGVATKTPTTWITYPAETHTLNPGEAIDVTFSVAVPADAQPGNYVSGLVVRTADAVPVAGSSQFDQIIQKAIGVVIRVPGDQVASLEVGEATYTGSTTGATVDIALTNTGNTFLNLVGEFALRDAGGNVLVSSPIAMRTFYTGTSTAIEFGLSQPLEEGEYTISLQLTDSRYEEINVDIDDLSLTATAPVEPVEVTVQFGELALEPGPDATAPVFATISGTIVNTGEPITSGRLSVVASLNGEVVETFALIPSLSLPQGSTPFEQRYIPGTGFTSGTWTFQLVLEDVDSSAGTGTVLLTQDLDQTITVP